MMKEKDRFILKSTSYNDLPNEIKADLPDWCVDQNTFLQYKEIIRISRGLDDSQSPINNQVKLRLDELFHQKRTTNWYMFNFLAWGHSSNNNQKAIWMGLAAVCMIALVSTVFIWQYAQQEPKRSMALEQRKDRKADLNEIQVNQTKPTKQSKQISTSNTDVQLAEVQIAENTLEPIKNYPEIAAADAEVMNVNLEAVVADAKVMNVNLKVERSNAYENTTETTLFSLSNPIYNNLLDRLEPTF